MCNWPQVWDLVLTWEHFDVNLIRPQTRPTEISSWWVEGSAKIPKTKAATLQWGGHIHNLEHMERKK